MAVEGYIWVCVGCRLIQVEVKPKDCSIFTVTHPVSVIILY